MSLQMPQGFPCRRSKPKEVRGHLELGPLFASVLTFWRYMFQQYFCMLGYENAGGY